MEGIRYILASASPRRREILKQVLKEFDVMPSGIQEIMGQDREPVDIAMDLALSKALNVSSRYPDAIVIGADTIIVLEGVIIGKPADEGDAVRILETLSGKTHQVVTGVAVVNGTYDLKLVNFEFSDVTFKNLDRSIIESYVREKKPLDMAGGYGIQDVMDSFVENLEGDFQNVVGLPPGLIAEMLDAMHSEIDRA